MSFLEQNTRFDHTSPYLSRPLSAANFSSTRQWTTANHYRTSYRDMATKVSFAKIKIYQNLTKFCWIGSTSRKVICCTRLSGIRSRQQRQRSGGQDHCTGQQIIFYQKRQQQGNDCVPYLKRVSNTIRIVVLLYKKAH